MSTSQHACHSKKFLIPVLIIGAALAGVVYFSQGSSTIPSTDSQPIKAIVYRSPSCGCCGQYVSYLKQNGFDVESIYVDEATDRGSQFDVPNELGSCHTTVIGDYAIEGHVPIEAIQKLLNERPTLRGIALPSMPSGSPGMPGPKNSLFKIKGFATDGSVTDFMSI